MFERMFGRIPPMISMLFSVSLHFIILRKFDASAACTIWFSDMQMHSLAYLVESV